MPQEVGAEQRHVAVLWVPGVDAAVLGAVVAVLAPAGWASGRDTARTLAARAGPPAVHSFADRLVGRAVVRRPGPVAVGAGDRVHRAPLPHSVNP
jgi:hypothetical protein